MTRRRSIAIAVSAMVPVVLLLGVTASWASHGLTVDWYAQTGETRNRVVRTVEHRVEFRNEHRPLARYVDHWDERKLGLPSELPPVDATFRGTLTVPEGPPRQVHVRNTGSAVLRIDGRSADEPLSPGEHSLYLTWRTALQNPHHPHWDRSPPVDLLLWWDTGTSSSSIPQDAFRPLRNDSALSWILGFGTFLSLLLAGLVYRAARAEGEVRRGRVLLIGCILLTVLAGTLRGYEYTAAPGFRSNMDELFVMWNGWQLLEDGQTRGWSLWMHYYGGSVQHETVPYWSEQPVVTIQPYFEHPPLFHLMAGAAARLGGAEHFAHSKHRHARLVPITLSIIALWFTVAIATRLGGRVAGFLAGLLHAVMPIISLQSRGLKGDALIAVLLSGCVLAFLRWQERHRRIDLVWASLAAGLAVWAKIPAIVILIALGSLVVMERRFRDLIVVALVGGTVAALLLVFAATNWDAFWYAQEVQGTIRQVSPDVFTPWVLGAQVDHNQIGRPMLVFLWLATAVTCARWGPTKAAVLVVPLIIYTVALALPSGTWHYGWYLLPLYPLLCAGAGTYLSDLVRKPNLLGGFLVLGLLSFYALQLNIEPSWVNDGANFSSSRRMVWGIALLLLGPLGLVYIVSRRWTRRLGQAAVACAIALFVVASVRFTLLYDVTSRSFYDYDIGKPGVPVEGGRRDPYTADFGRPFDERRR